ncbi:MAG: glycosyltransferase family 2 protein [Sulfuriferula sp.]|nr:glycosyltransferase family 2 protein [Sulfuriferula sp.]
MSICAVVITYHPAEQIIGNILALLDQADEIVIVDNGSGSSIQELLGRLEQHSNVSVIYKPENIGIAAALNIGVKHAKKLGYEWVITFDQDSKVTPNMISTMLRGYEAYPEKEKVASLSPRQQDQASGRVTSNNILSPNTEISAYLQLLVVITSGNMVKLNVFDIVGYFNEALFIDHVDTEFCLRCATYGYKILEIQDAILEHSLGTPTQHSFLWTAPVTSNHSVLRRYYNARNGVYIYKKFVFSQPAWVFNHAYIYLKAIIVLMLFEDRRKKKLLAICRGVVHGLLGRLGKADNLFD